MARLPTMDLLLPQSNRGKLPIMIKSESECENDEIGIVFRYKDNKEGRMNSVLFIYTKSESEEVSGHIDLSARYVQVVSALININDNIL